VTYFTNASAELAETSNRPTNGVPLGPILKTTIMALFWGGVAFACVAATGLVGAFLWAIFTFVVPNPPLLLTCLLLVELILHQIQKQEI
jgi:hypothetical protein